MVKSKVFVSCGQHTATERQVAKDVCALPERLGFQPYLAINVQTIAEINAGILDIHVFNGSVMESRPAFRNQAAADGSMLRRFRRVILFGPSLEAGQQKANG